MGAGFPSFPRMINLWRHAYSFQGLIMMLTLVLLDMDSLISGLNEVLLHLRQGSTAYNQIFGILMDAEELAAELVELNEELDYA